MEADIWHQRTRGAATGEGVWGAAASLLTSCSKLTTAAAIAQLGERQTEDLKVPGSIPGLGTFEQQFKNDIARVSHILSSPDGGNPYGRSGVCMWRFRQ